MISSLAAIALAASFHMQLEVGAAHFVSQPQSSYFGWGEALSLRGDVEVLGPLAVQVSGTFVNVDAAAAFLKGPGRVAQAGVGAKVRFLKYAWADVQALWVGTGPFVRFGWELGAGGTWFIKDLVGLGPYLRFEHIVQPDSPGVDGSDAVLLHFGLAVTVRLGLPALSTPAPRPYPPPTDAPAPATSATTPATTITVAKSTDLDGDGIADLRDACRDEPEVFNGVDDGDGCPDPDKGTPLVKVSADGIEVVTPIRFEKGTRVDGSSVVTLGTLARVLALHPELNRVRLELADPNVELAKKRAAAVLQLLVDAGLPADRLEASGVFGKAGRLEVRVLSRE